ncbi:MAG: peptide deformylase [Bdellovibrionales bacterium]
MAKLEVITWPNPILKKMSTKIDDVDGELQQLAEDMLETMYDAPGVGLAAPQIGKNIRMIVVDTRSKDEAGNFTLEDMTELEQKLDYPLVLINPVVTKTEGKIKWEEGCLSVPGYTEQVDRAAYVEVTALDKNGKELNFAADSLTGVCIQHEIDHLDGKVFIERLSTIRRNRLTSKIKKYGYSTSGAEA